MSREAIEVGAFTWSRIQRLYDGDSVTHWQRCESEDLQCPQEASESRLGEAVMDAEVANCSASKHGPGQSVKFLAARKHIDNQLYALDLCL
jgi:hypothetical protein